MNTSAAKYIDVDDYIAKARPDVQDILERIRALVKKAVPDAVESISYGMPGYKLNGQPLVYFAAYDKHIGVYATPQSHEAFAEQLAGYKQGKGSVQFPLDQPIPYDLIEKMVAYNAEQLSL